MNMSFRIILVFAVIMIILTTVITNEVYTAPAPISTKTVTSFTYPVLVKISAPEVLTALELLENRCGVLRFLTDRLQNPQKLI